MEDRSSCSRDVVGMLAACAWSDWYKKSMRTFFCRSLPEIVRRREMGNVFNRQKLPKKDLATSTVCCEVDMLVVHALLFRVASTVLCTFLVAVVCRVLFQKSTDGLSSSTG